MSQGGEDRSQVSSRRTHHGRPSGERLKSRLRRPSSRALLGTVVGSGFGFILPFATTRHFGVGRLSDAYFFALALATFVSVVYEGVLQANLTPVLQADKLGGRAHFRHTVRRVLLQAAGAATLTYAAVAGVGGVLAVGGRANWTLAERHTTLIILALLTAYVVASAATAALASGLYALQDFFFPLGSMALRSIVPLVGLTFIGRGAASIELFALLMCIGEFGRGIFLGARLLAKSRSLPFVRSEQGVGVWKTGIPHAASMVVAVANPVIDRFFAAPLSAGSVTVLELGEKLLYAPLTALSSFFVLVAGVRWAEQSKTGEAGLGDDFQRTILKAAALATLIASVIILGMVAISHFGAHKIAGVNTSRLEPVVILLLLGLPGGLVLYLGARFLTATRRTYILPLFAILGLVVNTGGDYIGSKLLGLSGIALASTLMRYGNALLYIVVCRRILRSSYGEPSAIKGATPGTVTTS